MSSTRKAKDDSVFHQNRYASSAEYERGLLANLVAKRCTVVDDKSDRELIWFIQYLSHQDGGLAAVVKDLIAKFPERIQTAAMAAMKLKPGTICTAEQSDEIGDGINPRQRVFRIVTAISAGHCSKPVATTQFFEQCSQAAASELENELRTICLDPACKLGDCAPWYFPRLVETLREYLARYVQARGAGVVTTELGQKVCDTLDYTFRIRGFTLMEGHARRGKSFAAENWCARHPGRARFVEVATGNDDASFFRGLARGLGLGNFQQYKVSDIRERVESVLLTGQILLVLDEAQRLWPQMNMRYGTPKRITWLMSMANRNIPICAIATPQFMELQKASAEKNQWNSAQLAGRISHYELLPDRLSRADLVAVAGSVLPGVDSEALGVLADITSVSPRYLGAIKAVKDRANDYAMQAGRPHASAADVRRALKQSVVPSDTSMVKALETGRTPSAARTPPAAPQMPVAPGTARSDGDTTPDLESRQAEPLPAPRRGGVELVAIEPL